MKRAYAAYDTDWVGFRIISRSNEDEPAYAGTIVGWEEIHGQKFPRIKFDHENSERIAMSVLLPYHEGFLKFLNSLSSQESWELCSDYSLLNQEIVAKRARPVEPNLAVLTPTEKQDRIIPKFWNKFFGD